MKAAEIDTNSRIDQGRKRTHSLTLFLRAKGQPVDTDSRITGSTAAWLQSQAIGPSCSEWPILTGGIFPRSPNTCYQRRCLRGARDSPGPVCKCSTCCSLQLSYGPSPIAELPRYQTTSRRRLTCRHGLHPREKRSSLNEETELGMGKGLL